MARSQKKAKALWGGRFEKGLHPALKDFSYSLQVDAALFEAELEVDEAYVEMLGRIGVLTGSEKRALLSGLKGLEKKFTEKALAEMSSEYEDVHTFIQMQLEKIAGTAAKKIHTGRSRNDLVVTSVRVYLRKKIQTLDSGLGRVQAALVRCAERAGDAILPGLTHLKKAQPVLAAHHLLAYVEMIGEDRSRLADALKRTDVLALGSGSVAGTSVPVDRAFLAKRLGFSRISANSMAAVSDRGFMTELASDLAILWMHFSRLAEDFVLWNSEPFGFIELDDAFATGSSLMPHKKNPDAFELIRGRSGSVFADFASLWIVQKGLALSYNRDLQEDKPALFSAIRKTEGALTLLVPLLDAVSFRKEAMAAALDDDGLYATDLAECLVGRGLAFSEAHRAVGGLVLEARKRGVRLRDLPLEIFRRASDRFDKRVYELFDPAVSVALKKTVGGTNPAAVREEIRKWKRRLAS
jgi:argininosuccinate lyase